MHVIYLIMLHIDENVVKKFQLSLEEPRKKVMKIKAAKKLLKIIPAAIDAFT